MSDAPPAWSRSSLAVALPRADPVEDLSPARVFGSSTGRGVRVAVIDSGIEADHPLLEGSVDEGGGAWFTVDPAGRVDRRDGPHDDVYGHGTACAGIIHALAPEARITSVRVLDASLRGRAAAFLAGLSWAVDQGFDVINLSLGASNREWALAFHDACDRGYFANSFIVTAASNVAQESFPSLFASVTSVACNHSDDPRRFHVNPEPPTEFLARGLNVEVAWRGGTTVVTSGNSFAAPHIAGFAALIKAGRPGLRPFQVKSALWAAAANVREAVPPTDRRVAPTASRPSSHQSRGRPGTRASGPGPLLDGFELGPPLPPDPWGSRHLATGGPGRVVLRRLDPRLATEHRIRARLEATVRIVAGLHHPNLLPVLEVRMGGDDIVLVHPWCPDDLARRHRARPLPPPVAVAVVLDVLAGLGAAHAAGVFHGDLRPDNVLIDTAGQMVVSDVGLAAALSSDIRTSAAPTDPLSWTYLAPEQLDGAAVGAYTDVHAAGLILFELLTGELPHPAVASLGALVGQRARERPRSVADLAPGLDPGLARVVDRAVATDPIERPATVGALARALTTAARVAFGPRWDPAGGLPPDPTSSHPHLA